MSISRAFTTRNKWTNSDEASRSMPSLLTKASLKSLDRSKISAPVLLATTNVDTFSAPSVQDARQLRKVSSISSNSSRNSDNHSEASSNSPRSRSTSVTDSSSIGSLPSSPKPTQYEQSFGAITALSSSPPQPPPRRAASSADLKRRAFAFEQSPLLPQRAPTHSKAAHEQLARKASLQQMNTWQEPARSVPPSPSRRELRTSKDIFNHKIDSHHPFGRELEQLDEIAEEFGGAVRDAERDADANVMRQKSLASFSAAEYMMDIQPLFERFFLTTRLVATPPKKPAEGWI